MKLIKTLICLLFITLLSSPSWSETLTMNDLVENPSDGLVYKKFTTIPFSGSVLPTSEDPSSGSYKGGRRHGLWETFHQNGLLLSKGNYKGGKEEGLWEYYDQSGIREKTENYEEGVLGNSYKTDELRSSGDLKDGKKDGPWEYYDQNNSLVKTEYYEDGRLLGKEEELGNNRRVSYFYYETGELKMIINKKNGKNDGLSVMYNLDGTNLGRLFYKNGELIDE